MTQNQPERFFERRGGDGYISAVAFGGFLVVLGLVFVLNPNLWNNITYFFDHISTRTVPLSSVTSNIVLPAPINPGVHTALYEALFQFDVAFGFLQVVILAIRVWAKSRVGRLSETVGNAVFWLGAAGLVQAFLLQGPLISWFQYWAALIILVGVSFFARAAVYFGMRK